MLPPIFYKGCVKLKTTNIYYIHDDGTAELLCQNTKVLLDAEDVKRVSEYQWSREIMVTLQVVLVKNRYCCTDLYPLQKDQMLLTT